MTASPAPASLLGLQQHWQELCSAGLAGYEWLGVTLHADGLATEIDRERFRLRELFAETAASATSQPVVGICLPDEIPNLVVGVALLLEGICQAIVPIHASPSEQHRLAERFRLSHWIGLTDPPAGSAWMPLGPTSQGLGCWRNLQPSEHPYSDEPPKPSHGLPLLLGTTSGTTSGHPGLVWAHSQGIHDRVLAKRWSPYNLVTRPLVTPDLQNWSSRINKLLLLLKGRGFVCRAAEAALADHPLPDDCNGALMAPGALRRRLARGDLLHCPTNFLIISGSDRIPKELRQAVADLGTVALGLTYATSQTGPLTWLPPEALLDEPDSVGWLLDDVQLEPLSEGAALQRGDLTFREALITTPDKTLNPGDLLAISSSGQVIFGGRSNDVFLFNSILISPYEIEDVLRQHPGVDDCAAFGAQSERFGNVPMAAVTTKPNWAATKIIQELEELCRDMLGIRRPRQLVLMETIPKGSTGKALRRELSRMHALQQ